MREWCDWGRRDWRRWGSGSMQVMAQEVLVLSRVSRVAAVEKPEPTSMIFWGWRCWMRPLRRKASARGNQPLG